MKQRFCYTTLLTIDLLAAFSCGRHHASMAVPAAEPVHGLSALTILTPGRSAAETEDPRPADSKYRELLPPRPIGELKGPTYPEEPLRDGYGAAVVVVRVFLDADGSVVDIEDSPVSPSTGGRYSAQFRSTVEEAVRQWKFQPAEYRRYDQGKDLNGDGKPDYMVLVDSKPVPVHFDARFDFSIIKGKGLVQSR